MMYCSKAARLGESVRADERVDRRSEKSKQKESECNLRMQRKQDYMNESIKSANNKDITEC